LTARRSSTSSPSSTPSSTNADRRGVALVLVLLAPARSVRVACREPKRRAAGYRR
jgi:hypothetical protein